jgi:uncharacterized membrane protein YjjP (DUF1212 family)
MPYNIFDNFKKKSLKQRFLLVISLLNFISFFILGSLLLFWEKLQLNLPNTIQGLVGGLIILFGFFRFTTQMKRLMSDDDE